MVREKKETKTSEAAEEVAEKTTVVKRASKVPPETKRKSGSRRMERMLDSIASGQTDVPHSKAKISHGGHRKSTTDVHIQKAKENRACVLPKAPLSRIFHEAMQMGVPDVIDADGKRKKGKQMRIEKKAFAIVQEAIETELCRKIRGAREIAAYSKRKTVMGKDMDFYNHITQKSQPVCV
jgi:histone H3/H4